MIPKTHLEKKKKKKKISPFLHSNPILKRRKFGGIKKWEIEHNSDEQKMKIKIIR